MEASISLSRRQVSAMLFSTLTAASLPGWAQDKYPSKPIHLVVPFSAGGAVDTVGRTLGERLAAQMGQSVIVDNKPGANANIGTEAVARAEPDGYTLLVAANGVVTNNILYPKLSFDGLSDFAPISQIGYAPLVLVVPADSPYKSVKELVAAAKAMPGSLSYGSAGNGSSGHLAGALFASEGKFDALHVAYKGGAPALVDLIAGRISFMLLNPLEVSAHLKSGRLRALAVSDAKRSPMLSDVPTMAEAGFPGVQATVWWTLLAPKGTPAPVVARLNSETHTALDDAAVRERLGALGAVITPSTPQETAAFLRSESAKWEKVIRASHIQAD